MRRRRSVKNPIIWVLAVALAIFGGSAGVHHHNDRAGSSVSSRVTAMRSSISNSINSHNSSSSQALNQSSSSQQGSSNATGGVNDDVQKASLVNYSAYRSGSNPVVVLNGNKATLDSANWKQDKIYYSNLDNLNRVGTNTGYLTSSNLIKSSTRSGQEWKPTGWHQKFVNHEAIINRGHSLAYTFTGNIDNDGNYHQGALGSLDNPKNLTTQTAYSNQVLFQRYEEQVRDALGSGKKVIVQVTPLFKGNDLMPFAYHYQALSTDQSLNFNVLIYNVQNGVVFNYGDGTSQLDSSFSVPR